MSLQSCNGRLLDSADHLRKAVEEGFQLLLAREDSNHVKRRRSILKSTQHLSVTLEVSYTETY